MLTLKYCIVDVFAPDKFSGNQLAVFRDGSSLTGGKMQAIAREMNFSETTFILSDEENDGGYDVRIFTPAAELPFAGHPTLGTAYIIQQEIIRRTIEKVNLNLKVGRIPVTFNYENERPGLLWMKQNEPEFGGTFDKTTVATILNLKKADIDDRYPIEEVSTGFYAAIIPLKTIDAVRRARVNVPELLRYIQDKKAKTLLIFCPETFHPENDLHVRFFADYLGIQEDPATGSANGCLAAYLVKNRFLGGDSIDVRVEQGYEIKRPSLLLLMAGRSHGKINVHVGGQVQMIARGEMYL